MIRQFTFLFILVFVAAYNSAAAIGLPVIQYKSGQPRLKQQLTDSTTERNQHRSGRKYEWYRRIHFTGNESPEDEGLEDALISNTGFNPHQAYGGLNNQNHKESHRQRVAVSSNQNTNNNAGSTSAVSNGQYGQEVVNQGSAVSNTQGSQTNVMNLRTTQRPPMNVPQNQNTIENVQIRDCIQNKCPSTNEYNPVCGDDNITYTNPNKLKCAQFCKSNVTVQHQGACVTTPAPN